MTQLPAALRPSSLPVGCDLRGQRRNNAINRYPSAASWSPRAMSGQKAIAIAPVAHAGKNMSARLARAICRTTGCRGRRSARGRPHPVMSAPIVAECLIVMTPATAQSHAPSLNACAPTSD